MLVLSNETLNNVCTIFSVSYPTTRRVPSISIFLYGLVFSNKEFILTSELIEFICSSRLQIQLFDQVGYFERDSDQFVFKSEDEDEENTLIHQGNETILSEISKRVPLSAIKNDTFSIYDIVYYFHNPTKEKSIFNLFYPETV